MSSNSESTGKALASRVTRLNICERITAVASLFARISVSTDKQIVEHMSQNPQDVEKAITDLRLAISLIKDVSHFKVKEPQDSTQDETSHKDQVT